MKAPKPSPRWRLIVALGLLIGAGLVAVVVVRPLASGANFSPLKQAQATATLTVKPSKTPTSVPATITSTPPGPTATQTMVPETLTLAASTATLAIPAATDTPAPTDTQAPTVTAGPSVTVAPTNPPLTPTPGAVYTPWPAAPLCPDLGEAHDFSAFHTLWDSVRGCHYDHEHGQDPFTPAVAVVFPGFDLQALLGGVQIGHTNPSSPLENTAKHGGFKWDVTLAHSAGCATGPNGEGNAAGVGIDAFAIQYHNFGDYSIEFNARVHSAGGLLRQCLEANPTDFGYIYTVQFQDYGQRVVPYQGIVYPYPDTPDPAYNPGLSPYFTVDCIGAVIQCRASRQFVLTYNANAASTWVSVPQAAPISSPLFAILFRLRDTYQLIDYNDQTYPFTFIWMCSGDGGLTYQASAGCKYNNSTSRIHEVHGTIPAAWDNLVGFDTDSRVGRVTGEGFVTSTGALTLSCTTHGPTCFPIKLVSAFVGRYRSAFGLEMGKGQFTVGNLPERDVYFCAGLPCAETDAGAVASGWIGQGN